MSVSIEPILESESGIEVVIRTDQNQGVEVQHLRSYGVGIDCHSKFIAICVHVRNNHKILRYSCEADTDWNFLVLAKQWVLDTILKHSDPVPDLSQPLHYVIEATSTYHMPVIRAWQGLPSVINPTMNLHPKPIIFSSLSVKRFFPWNGKPKTVRFPVMKWFGSFAQLLVSVRLPVSPGWRISVPPNRFRNAKALAAYAGLDPSLKVSAGKVTSTKKRGGCQILHKILVAGADRIIIRQPLKNSFTNYLLISC